MVILFAGMLAGGLFLIQQYIYKNWWDKGVEAVLRFEEEAVTVGEYVNLLEIIENRKWLPLSSLKVKFQCSRKLQFPDNKNSAVTDKYYRNDLFSVMPFKKVTRTLKIYCPSRGYYGIEGIDLVGADLFFSEEMSCSMGSNASLYVVPAALQTKETRAAVMKINGEIAAKRYELEDPFTYRGIRDYEQFDEMKTVNWKATAKTGDLKVNIRDHTAVSAVRIFMNLEDTNILRREELLEMSISLCAYLAENLISQGIRVSVYANAKDCISKQILELTDHTNQGSLKTIYKALARLDLEEKTEDFVTCFGKQLQKEQNSLYTIFISPDRHVEFQELLLTYPKKEEFIWLCPVKNDEISTILEALRRYTILLQEEQK